MARSAKNSKKARGVAHRAVKGSGTSVTRQPRRAAGFGSFVVMESAPAAKIEVIRNGVTARVVDDMVTYLGVSKTDIFRVLRTPESTAHKLIKENRPLDAAASERVVRVADITRLAEETFGGQEAARQWLTNPNLALEEATPLSMLDTEPGAGEVRRILSAINYGGAF